MGCEQSVPVDTRGRPHQQHKKYRNGNQSNYYGTTHVPIHYAETGVLQHHHHHDAVAHACSGGGGWGGGDLGGCGGGGGDLGGCAGGF